MDAQVTSTSRASGLRFEELLPDVWDLIINGAASAAAKAVLNRVAKAVRNQVKLLRKRQPPEEPRRVRVLRVIDTVTMSGTVTSHHQDPYLAR